MPKICITCEDSKDIDAFGLCTTAKDGHRGECRKCRADYLKEWRKGQKSELSNIKGGNKLLAAYWPKPRLDRGFYETVQESNM